MAGKFELYEDRAGKFRFRLKAGNGEVIATSEAYNSKASAWNGVEAVRRIAGTAAVEVLVGGGVADSDWAEASDEPPGTGEPGHPGDPIGD